MSYNVKSIADLGSVSSKSASKSFAPPVDNTFGANVPSIHSKKNFQNRNQSNIFSDVNSSCMHGSSVNVNTRAPFERAVREPTDYSRAKLAVADNLDSVEYVERRNIAHKFRAHANESNIFGSSAVSKPEKVRSDPASFPAAGSRINRNQSSAMAGILSYE